MIKSGATLVVRPDSGDPVDVVHQCLVLLDEAFGARCGMGRPEPDAAVAAAWAAVNSTK